VNTIKKNLKWISIEDYLDTVDSKKRELYKNGFKWFKKNGRIRT